MTETATASLPRRRLLQAGAFSLLPALAPARAAGPASDLPPQELQRRFLLMRGTLDDRLVLGEIDGQFLAVVDGEMLPMCGLRAVTFTRWKALGDGRWLTASFEHVYYTDLATGAVLTEWKNPLTGRSVPVPVYSAKPSRRVLRPDLSFAGLEPLPPGVVLDDRVEVAQEDRGEQVFVQRVNAVTSRPGVPGRYRYGELVTMRAPLAALRDPQARQVPCTAGYTAVSSYRAWMQMGDQPGHLVTHGHGRYGMAVGQLHPVWLAAARAGGLDWLDDPAKRLAPLLVL